MDSRHTKLAVEIVAAIEHIERVQKLRGFSTKEVISKDKPIRLILVPPRSAMSVYAEKLFPHWK